MVPGFLSEKNSKATSRGSFRHLRGPQYQNGPQKWTPRPNIDRKLPPKLFFRTYLGLYQHRVDVETGSLHNLIFSYIDNKYRRIVHMNVATSNSNGQNVVYSSFNFKRKEFSYHAKVFVKQMSFDYNI